MQTYTLSLTTAVNFAVKPLCFVLSIQGDERREVTLLDLSIRIVVLHLLV
jgi:hypothetical protein